MKPLGLSIDMTANGIGLGVKRPIRAEDAIWEAVKEAIACGMTPRQFRIEAAQAWEDELQCEIKNMHKEMGR